MKKKNSKTHTDRQGDKTRKFNLSVHVKMLIRTPPEEFTAVSLRLQLIAAAAAAAAAAAV